MLQIRALHQEGIHDVFDGDIEHSHEVVENGEVLGYVCYRESEKEAKRIWMEFILAKHRGNGDGERMIHALFEKGYERIEGTAIYGPHFFWESVGAVFEDEVDEDACDGVWFTLSREDFYKKDK